MTLALDVSTQSAAWATATAQTASHVSPGVARFALVSIVQDGAGGDEVTAASYGGVAMWRVPNLVTPAAPGMVDGTANTEPGRVYFYALAGDIPTGTQTVSVTSSGTGPKRYFVTTLTGGATRISASIYLTQVGSSVTNPVLVAPAAQPVGDYHLYAAHSGLDTPPTVFNGTQVGVHDFGIASGVWVSNAIGAADTGSCGYTGAADDVASGLVWISELPPLKPKTNISPAVRRAAFY